LAGDEFGRTQRGNNNAYCQDNEISWVDWGRDERGEALTAFVRRLSTLRNTYPVLRRSRFLTEAWDEELGIKDSTWLTPNGEEMTAQNWQDPATKCFGLLLDGRAPMSGIRRRGSEATLLLVVNAYHDVVVFTLPKTTGGRDWLRLVDTNRPEEDRETGSAAAFKFGHRYEVTGRSLLLLLLRPARPQRRQTRDSSASEKPALQES
jgi:isoamylase